MERVHYCIAFCQKTPLVCTRHDGTDTMVLAKYGIGNGCQFLLKHFCEMWLRTAIDIG